MLINDFQTAAPTLCNNNSNNLNNDWQVGPQVVVFLIMKLMLLQVWDSRPVSRQSDVQVPDVTEPKGHISDTVIKVTEDGWRTVMQGSPLTSHFVSNHHLLLTRK
jgi:hypothetical protein